MKDESFLGLMKKLGQEGDQIPETTGFIDTGSYILNALISASIYGGFPNNRVTALAGEQGTYKSFFAMSAIAQFQKDNPTGGVLHFDTEFATDESMLLNRGIDIDRFVPQFPETLQDFRSKLLTFIDGYEKEKERPPVMVVLDSLGNLPSAKELADAKEGKDVRDMTRTQIIRSIFRTVTLKMGLLNIPLICTNHTYAVIGCLDGSQKVLLNDGTIKNISDIQIGDMVRTLGGSEKVSNLYQYDVDEYIELELADGKIIKATPEHKFMTVSGDWKMAKDITEDDDLLV